MVVSKKSAAPDEWLQNVPTKIKWVRTQTLASYVNIFNFAVTTKADGNELYELFIGAVDPQLQLIINREKPESIDMIPAFKLVMDEDGFQRLISEVEVIKKTSINLKKKLKIKVSKDGK